MDATINVSLSKKTLQSVSQFYWNMQDLIKGLETFSVSTQHVFCTSTSSADAKQLSLVLLLWCVLLTKEVLPAAKLQNSVPPDRERSHIRLALTPFIFPFKETNKLYNINSLIRYLIIVFLETKQWAQLIFQTPICSSSLRLAGDCHLHLH